MARITNVNSNEVICVCGCDFESVKAAWAKNKIPHRKEDHIAVFAASGVLFELHQGQWVDHATIGGESLANAVRSKLAFYRNRISGLKMEIIRQVDLLQKTTNTTDLSYPHIGVRNAVLDTIWEITNEHFRCYDTDSPHDQYSTILHIQERIEEVKILTAKLYEIADEVPETHATSLSLRYIAASSDEILNYFSLLMQYLINYKRAKIAHFMLSDQKDDWCLLDSYRYPD